MLCPSCNTPNRDTAKFCKVCGKLLAVEVVATEQPLAPVSESEEPQVQAPQPPTQETTPTSTVEDTVVEHSVSSAEAPTVYAPVPAPAPTSNEEAFEETVVAEPQEEKTLVDTNPVHDISQAPTQILTPQQMLSVQARRWQQEADAQKQQTSPEDDIADAPTILMAPMPASDEQTEAEIPAPPPPPDAEMPRVSDNETQPNSSFERKESAEYSTSDAVAESEQASPDEETVTTEDETQEENDVERSTQANSNDNQATDNAVIDDTNVDATNTEQENNFPVLEIGTKLQNRYEVTQVLSDDAAQHTYAVVDHEGYQRCWNCASEDNAEGDEFCINCGAELLNASYILHQYAPSARSDERVLQGTIVNTFVEDEYTYVVELQQELQSSSPNGLHLVACSESDAGNLRRSDINEDSTLAVTFERVHESITSPVGLYVVADGMGGHDNGQGASRMTIGLLAERVIRELIMPPLQTEKKREAVKALDEDEVVSILQGAIEEANTTLCQVNQQEKSDMGCTLTGFMIVGDYAYIFNVGDSRTYMLRDEKLYQLTNDHSLVWQLVAGGLITHDDIYTHPQRNQIFRSIGDKLNVQVDLTKQQVHPGDILLSCSDGLWEMIRDPQITEILQQAPDPQTACAQLIETANANGGEDNVSAVVVFVR